MANNPIDPTPIMAQHYVWQKEQEEQIFDPGFAATAGSDPNAMQQSMQRIVQESVEAVLRNIGNILPG
jgi:hypothetical protein